MSSQENNAGATVIPGLRYRDAPAAIQWLCEAFGFKRQAVHAKAEGAVIVIDIQDYGGSGISCRDPEGPLWNFGSYDPW